MKKIFLFAIVTIAALLSSCSSDDAFQPGQPAGKQNITFSKDNAKSVVITPTDLTFDVILHRADTNGELVVPVTLAASQNFFTFDNGVMNANAVFAEGESEATVTVVASSETPFAEDIYAKIVIDPEFSNPYLSQEEYPTYAVTVTREDYMPWADATYEDGFWYEGEWDVLIEYSEILGVYRVKDMMDDGYNFYFTMDEETNLVTPCDATGNAVTKMAMPTFVHPSYGIVSWNVAAANVKDFAYFPSEGAIQLAFQWTVSAGSFGVYPCYLWINEFYN